jgi:hypothetical protein
MIKLLYRLLVNGQMTVSLVYGDVKITTIPIESNDNPNHKRTLMDIFFANEIQLLGRMQL